MFRGRMADMRMRWISYGRMLAVLAVVALVCACAGGKAVSRPRLSPEPSLSALVPAVNDTDNIVATAQIDLITAEGHYPVRTALILRKPSYLRMELLPLIGTPDFFLTATPEIMKIFIPSRGEFYSGKPTAENLGRFLPWVLSIEDVVMIFSGAYPLPAGENLSYESFAEASLLRVEMKSSGGGSQSIWMEKNGRIVKFVRSGPDGREIYSVQYEDYRPGTSIAGRITIKMADHVTSLSVKYTDIQIGKTADLSVFDLTVPADVKKILLD